MGCISGWFGFGIKLAYHVFAFQQERIRRKLFCPLVVLFASVHHGLLGVAVHILSALTMLAEDGRPRHPLILLEDLPQPLRLCAPNRTKCRRAAASAQQKGKADYGAENVDRHATRMAAPRAGFGMWISFNEIHGTPPAPMPC